MKERDFSDFEKEKRTVPISEFFSEATFEVPANRKARRDVMRRNGEFKKRRKRCDA